MSFWDGTRWIPDTPGRRTQPRRDGSGGRHSGGTVARALRIVAGLAVVVSPIIWAAALSSPSLGHSPTTEQYAAKAADLGRAIANGGISPDRLIVMYEPGAWADQAVRGRVHGLAGGQLLRADASVARELIRVPNGSSHATAQRLRAIPGVLDAYADHVASVALLVDDPRLRREWGLETIQAPAAWDMSQGNAIRVAVLDCGIHASHPDLTGKVVLEANYTASPTTDDLCNHGTHVAGTIAATTNNSVGIAAVAPGATLLNGKVLSDTGNGFFSDVDTAIMWAADNGAKVISMSLGATIPCPSGTQAAANYAWTRGAVIVAAAGNSAASGAMAPANCQNVMGVAATDSRDLRASFSNVGFEVDVAAPGVSIDSTVNPILNAGKEYATFSGTSMATPHAAGVLALIWATNPAASPSVVRDRLFTTADQIAGTGTSWTYGRINAAAAVAGSQLPPPGPSPSPDPSPPAAEPSPPAPPAAPGTVTITTRPQFMRLTWEASATSGVTYTVYRGTVPGGTLQPVASDQIRIRWDDRDLLSGQEYCYQVTARNADGESPPSAEACGIAR